MVRQMMVGRGMWDGLHGLAVVLTTGLGGRIEAHIIDGPDQLREWTDGPIGAVEVPAYAYDCDPPPCGECGHYDMCRDIAADDHDTDDGIAAAMAAARETQCLAVDLDRLLADAQAHEDDLAGWAAGL